jgi:hypothetical protein
MVECIAKATIQLLEAGGIDVSASRFRRPHRYLLDRLETKEAQEGYRTLQLFFATKASGLRAEFWNNELQRLFKRVFRDLTQLELPANTAEFLAWDDTDPSGETTLGYVTNTFTYQEGGASFPIRLSSIHSVKGETHLSTLVLESYWHQHQLQLLKPWLLGKSGGAGVSDQMKKRLRLHYVAMTRPSRLLCLALRKDGLEATEIAELQNRGWTVVECPVFVEPVTSPERTNDAAQAVH